MAKDKRKKEIEYKQRVNELKQKLKSYRNNQTVNLLRLITGSSTVRLEKYWQSLESVLTGHHRHRVVQEKLQSKINMITENREKIPKHPIPTQ
ncbi:unnamed protein product [Macrosiphum euphorbiae]|uniref:Uncharacterized protein n=1 Tax=Macrosiphum euphorbiae TaxID=13131 RepID=A0AAV0WFV9_9HEMI|nr:unnamed protein product [Macrosiphum euphorbiae]